MDFKGLSDPVVLYKHPEKKPSFFGKIRPPSTNFMNKVGMVFRNQSFLVGALTVLLLFAIGIGVYVSQKPTQLVPHADTPVCSNLIANGDFEQPVISQPATNNSWEIYGALLPIPGLGTPAGTTTNIPGWDPRAPGAIIQIELQKNLFGTAAKGSQYAEIDQPGKVTVTQSVPTVEGGQYEIKFSYSSRPGFSEPQKLGVYWNGLQVGTVVGTSQGSGLNWQVKTFTVTGINGNSKLGFGALAESAVDKGNLVDDVSVTSISACASPSPSPIPSPSPSISPSPSPSSLACASPPVCPAGQTLFQGDPPDGFCPVFQCVPVSPSPSPSSSPSPSGPKGDGNRDGNIDLSDLSILYTKWSTAIDITSNFELDFDDNKRINSLDHTMMRQKLIELGVIKE